MYSQLWNSRTQLTFFRYHKTHGHPHEHNLHHGIEPRVSPGLCVAAAAEAQRADVEDIEYIQEDLDTGGDENEMGDKGDDSDVEIEKVGFELNEQLGAAIALREAGNSTPVGGEEWEQWLKIALKDASSIDTLEQTGGTFAKDDVAFTDSAYKSAPTLENVRDDRLVPEELPPPPNDVDSPPGWGDTTDDDAKTSFSIGTDEPQQTRQYILELCNDIYSKLHRCVNPENISVFSNLLPELLKALAIKLCHDAPTQENHTIMYFIYRQNK